VFLHDLSEKTIGSATNIGNDEFTDAIEEELCEAERYKDLNAELAKEKVETVEKRGKGAEIAFSYGSNGNDEKDQEEDNDDLSDESDGDNSEPYEIPAEIKMPVGINLPETARKGHIIERTARFVASHGNQVEIIIKAKHRNHRERFDFLEFDHPLNSFYKYMCKLIREKKYVPPPIKPKLLPGEHTAQQKPVKESDDSDSDSDGGDYLHPLLSAKPRQSVSSPIPLPVPSSSNKANPYSSLYDNLYQNQQKQEPTTSKETVAESTTKVSKQPTVNFENDQQEISNYNAWHQSFYGRPSVFMPTQLPRLKIPPNLVISQINVAARYVAGNGAFSERTLLEHNNGRLNFLFPNSEYLIYYHNKVRFFQARLNSRVAPFVHSKYHKEMEPIKDLPLRPPAPAKVQTVVEQSNFNDFISNIPSAPLPPEPIKTKEFPDNDSKIDETDEEVKKKRKERAQQFMADIIRKKKVGGSDEKSEVQELLVPADIIVPNLISSLVSGQLEKITLKKESDSVKNDEKERDRKKRSSRSPRRRRSRSRERSRRSSRERSHRRRRSRSPSYERHRRRSPSYDESDRKRRRRSRS